MITPRGGGMSRCSHHKMNLLITYRTIKPLVTNSFYLGAIFLKVFELLCIDSFEILFVIENSKLRCLSFIFTGVWFFCLGTYISFRILSVVTNKKKMLPAMAKSLFYNIFHYTFGQPQCCRIWRHIDLSYLIFCVDTGGVGPLIGYIVRWFRSICLVGSTL